MTAKACSKDSQTMSVPYIISINRKAHHFNAMALASILDMAVVLCMVKSVKIT